MITFIDNFVICFYYVSTLRIQYKINKTFDPIFFYLENILVQLNKSMRSLES